MYHPPSRNHQNFYIATVVMVALIGVLTITTALVQRQTDTRASAYENPCDRYEKICTTDRAYPRTNLNDWCKTMSDRCDWEYNPVAPSRR